VWRGVTRTVVYIALRHPLICEDNPHARNSQTISQPMPVPTHSCFPCRYEMKIPWSWSAAPAASIHKLLRIPQDLPGYLMIPWPGAIEWVGGRYTWDDLVVVRSPTTMRHPLWGGGMGGVHHRTVPTKVPDGEPPYACIESFGVAHRDAPLSVRHASPMRESEGVLLDGGGGPGQPGRSRLRARLGPLSGCPTGSF